MNKRTEPVAAEQELPTVDEHVIEALRHFHNANPGYAREIMRRTIEEDQEFAHQIVIEANRRSNGDIGRQEAFIQGANFAREALRRTIAINNLSELFEASEIPVGEEDFEAPGEAAA